jgi:hypothetical protein
VSFGKPLDLESAIELRRVLKLLLMATLVVKDTFLSGYKTHEGNNETSANRQTVCH